MIGANDARGAAVALIERAIDFATNHAALAPFALYGTTIPALRALLADVRAGSVDAAAFVGDPDTSAPWFTVMHWAEDDLGRDMWSGETEDAA
jgi:hypothetical protein